MTPEEIQSLRDWAAEKMECELVYSGGIPMRKFLSSGRWDILHNNWKPDTDLNQAFQVVEKVEEDGAEVIVQKTQTQVFYRGSWHQHGMEGRALNTLKAIKKAMEGK